MLLTFRKLISRLLPENLRPTEIVYRNLLRRSGGKVIQGVFKGLDLNGLGKRIYTPLLLGTWEKELEGVVRDIQQSGIKTLVNIGAAEGYYSVGLLKLIPDLKCTAFETRPEMHDYINRIAADNNVAERLKLLGHCDLADLQSTLKSCHKALVLMDVEGAEKFLLDLDAIPQLEYCCILVEEHEVFVPGITEILKQRFRNTHDIQIVEGQHRTSDDLPPHSIFARPWLMRLMNESRSQLQSWLYMKPRNTEAL